MKLSLENLNLDNSTGHEPITEELRSRLYNSIVNIRYIQDNIPISGTGFFLKIKINNQMHKYLITCKHVITDECINNKEEIDLYYGPKDTEQKISMQLNDNLRKIIIPNEIDIILIEIIQDDKIPENKYLIPDSIYEYGFNNYIDKNCYLAGYPENLKGRCSASGQIKKIGDEEFVHTISTEKGCSGSPICNSEGNVIGIHRRGGDKKENYGIFIGPIIEYLKTNQNSKLNIITNYITGTIEISDEDINKNIRIINSYEQCVREDKWPIEEEYKNEKEIKENCEIRINDMKIPFTYFYTFKSTGKYTITYSFTNYLTKTNHMFYGCNKLSSLDLSNFNTKNVTNMRSMFGGCSSLKDLNLSNFNTKNVTDMCDMFWLCSSLKDLNLSNFNTKNVYIMAGMFSRCSSLKDINLSNFNTKNVTNMGSMFYGCSSLKDLNLSNFNTQNVSNMYQMFEGCSSLKDLNLSNFNTKNVTNMNGMFNGCSSLKSLVLSNIEDNWNINMQISYKAIIKKK